MAASQSIHWHAPTAMLAALLVGLVFAIAHHVFYNILDGRPVSTDLYSIAGVTVSPQQVNIAGGTAFAFLVSSCFTTAIAIAYSQIVWTSIIGKPVRLLALESVFAVLGNAFKLLDFTTWWEFRPLFFLALVAWLVPIAAVVTPAALTVIPKPLINSSTTAVPNINFESLEFTSQMPLLWGIYTHRSGPGYYKYTGPQLVVKQLAAAVAAQGSILGINPPALNASWTLPFIGPSLQCQEVEHGLRTAIEKNIHWASFSCLKRYAYVAWTPTMDDAMPFASGEPQTFRTAPLNPKQSMNSSKASEASAKDLIIVKNATAAATLYVAVFPDIYSWASVRNDAQCRQAIRDSIILECSVHNTSRMLDFDYINGAQKITSKNVSLLPQAKLTPLGGVYGPGEHYYAHDTCATLNTEGRVCLFDTNVARTLAYQAIMESFGQLLIGSIRWPAPGMYYVWSKSTGAFTTKTGTWFVGGSSSSWIPTASSSSSYSSHVVTTIGSSATFGSDSLSSSQWPARTSPLVVSNYGVGAAAVVDTDMTSTVILDLPIFSGLKRQLSDGLLYTKDLRTSLEDLDPAALSARDIGAISINMSLKNALEQLF